MNSAYQGPIGDHWVTVYAGGRFDPPGGLKGAAKIAGVRVYQTSDGIHGTKFLVTVDAPDSRGHEVEIVAVAGSKLTLRRDDGAQYVFDLATFTFAM